jgi:hypothetical protein
MMKEISDGMRLEKCYQKSGKVLYESLVESCIQRAETYLSVYYMIGKLDINDYREIDIREMVMTVNDGTVELR